jgi:mono/diheme cytochrome c family protein
MKSKWLTLLIYLLGGFALLIIIALTYVKTALPNVGPPPEMEVERTVARIKRGAYLTNGVMVCMQCHSQRDFTLFAAPSKPGTEGIGGEIHDQRLGFPGRYVSTNLTPYHLGEWTDGEIFRAITAGVNRDGKALFPIMPHPNFGQLDEEDIKSVIAYLRTLEPAAYNAEPSRSDFPMNFIINLIPQKASLQPAPARNDRVSYGEYLVTAGSCRSCHTRQDDNGSFVGPEFGGGMEFPLEDGSVVRASNITPHAAGIGNWSVEEFVQRFKAFSDSGYVASKVKPGDFQTVMPWYSYAKMTEEDLLAVYQYLRTVSPAEQVVERFTPFLHEQ